MTPSSSESVGGPANVPGSFGMDQESGAAVQIGAHEVDAALGIVPVLNDYILELFVQELLGGLFEGGLHFDKVRQDADGVEVFGFTALNGREQALDAFGGIGAMGDDFFERILAGFQSGRFGTQLIEQFARFGGLQLARVQFFFDATAFDRLWTPVPSAVPTSCRDNSAFDYSAWRSSSAPAVCSSRSAASRIAIDAGQDIRRSCAN